MTPDLALKLIEALRLRGFHVVVRATADSEDTVTTDGRYSVMLRGFGTFTGSTFVEAMERLKDSRCWEGEPVPGDPVRVKVADILATVEEHASQFTSPFRADEVALELNVYPAAVGQALKKLNWPKSQKKATVTLNGRELEVFVYLPKIG